MALAFQTATVFSAAALTRTDAISGAGNYFRHRLYFETVGGQWDFQVEGSPDNASWYKVGSSVAVNATTNTAEVTGCHPYLRLVSTRTGGTATVQVVQSDGHADAPR